MVNKEIKHEYVKEHLEKTSSKYVIATLDSPTLYMNKIYRQKKYVFTANIELATKFMSKSVAEIMIDYYRQDMYGIDNKELIILPILVKYCLLEETAGDYNE